MKSSHEARSPKQTLIKQNYEVEILVHGKPIQEYYQKGRDYIEGKKGAEFSIRLRNNGSQRALFIPSIDGLSVLNGKKAGFDSSGYIVDGYSSLTIDGWRISDKDVKKFFFTDPGNSYAEKKSEGENLGVIGVAVFRERYQKELDEIKRYIDEKEKARPYHFHHSHCLHSYCGFCHTYHFNCGPCSYTYTTTTGGSGSTITLSSASLSGSATSSSVNMMAVNTSNDIQLNKSFSSQELGTGWGETKRSEVRTVEFERESAPDAVFEIYYNTKEQLERLGISFQKAVYVAPQAFPNQYCEPPKK